MNESWLPPGFAPGRLAATIGLISDTHLPERRRTLPPALHAIFEGVDLLLHAGDAGELRVLDELGEIAVVVAVHGNDDTLAARRELPEQQVLAVRHVAIDTPETPFNAEVDWPAGFGWALGAVSETIVAPDLEPFVAAFKNRSFAGGAALKASCYRLAHRCWSGEQDLITRADLLKMVETDPAIVPADRATARVLLAE